MLSGTGALLAATDAEVGSYQGRLESGALRTAAQAIAGLDVEPNAVTVEQRWALIACRARTGLFKEHAGGGSCAPEIRLQQPRRSYAEPRIGSHGDSY